MAINIIWSSTTGNVTATASYSTAALPVDNDSLSLPSVITQALTTNLAGLTLIDLDLLYVDGQFGGAVGTDGTPFEISADLIKFFGGQAFHYKVGSVDSDLMIIRANAPGTIITLDGDTITKVIVLRGNVTLKSSMGTVTDLHIGWVDNRQNDANVTLQGDGTLAVTNLKMGGGQLSSNAAVTNTVICGGNMTQDIATATNVDIYDGFFNYNHGGTVALLNMFGGKTDFSQTDSQKTITNSNRFPNSEFLFNEDTTTFTNPVQDMRVNK